MTVPLHELIAHQAVSTPLAVAVDGAQGPLSYEALDRRANRVARLLAARGIGAEDRVVVCLPRGHDLVAALLGVWKAGAAYVPLDAGHPQERTAWVVADSGAGAVVTTAADAGTFEKLLPGGVVTLDSEILDELSDTAPPSKVTADHAAYLTYTSGSTGRPKGVLVQHGGIAGRVAWSLDNQGLTTADRVLQKTVLTFDAAGWELFTPLAAGATVVMAPPGAEADPALLVATVADTGVTVLQGVPSVLRLLVAEPRWADCADLRLVCSAGEPLDAELCRRLAEPGGARVWNTYGPTECSIDVTAQLFDPERHTEAVPIGRPMDHMRVYVLDAEFDPVPIGVVGELYAAGDGTARGYAGRPGQTAERFLPDPHGTPGSRMYRTGDLVRWRSDGALDFLGRADQQVKVNGVRIEPAEVEAALNAHPDVRGAVVDARVAGDTKRLVAYVTAGRRIPRDELRTFLRGRLPEPMIPSVFVPLDAFPLTSSGKVDRGALPDPVQEQARGAEYIAPRTPAERLVAQVWEQLLQIEQVGAHDDFFALGGSSLVLTRLADALRKASGDDIQLRGLFGAFTVEAQARLLEDARPAVPGVTPVGRDRPLPLSFGQHRLWFLDRMHPGSPEWVAPFFLRLPAGTTRDAVQAALDALEARHESLRTRYPVEGEEPRQEVVAPGTVELRVEDASEAHLERLFGEQFGRGFDLTDGPLWRALLVRVPKGGPVLLVTTHHIATDGWSTVLLDRELRELCAAASEDRSPRLDELPVQYADFAAWQSAHADDIASSRELDHWKQALDGLPELRLPTDRPRPARRDAHGSGVRFSVPASLADTLTGIGRRHGATPYVTLLAAFGALLGRYSGQDDFGIGSPVTGRTRPETQNTVGFFLNSLVMRCDLTGDPTFAELLQRVRGTVMAGFAHQELPFERLVDELQPARDLSRTPLYQVAFDLQDDGATSVAADDVLMDAFQGAWRVAKTDLTLFVWRQSDGSLIGAFEYATSLFDHDTVERLAHHFVQLLEAVAADADASLSAVDITSVQERRLLKAWNDTVVPVGEVSVPELIAERAVVSPGAVAVEAGGVRLTFGELEVRANRLAGVLRSRGVGAESSVAVLLDRSVDLVVALLGVWRAGAGYVPLDPALPEGRVAGMLVDAGVSVAVTSAGYADRFAVEVVRADEDHPEPVAGGVLPSVDLDALAYTIFTSGSTGRPKGVQVTHRSLVNHVDWAVRELASCGAGGAPVFSSVAFDLVVPNVWAPLAAGQRVWLYGGELTELGGALVGAGPFSFLKLTPGHLELLGGQLSDEEIRSLTTRIVVAGEALPGALVERWRRLLGNGRMVNEYGPTEATVGTCVFPIETAYEGVVPIGRPLPNVHMRVLDVELRPVPVGVVGELYVGGSGVARGYTGDAGRTAQRFLPDPYGGPGARLYRTGDLARWRADGAVEFLGRIDDQVKVRGYRIELGEIRAALAAHPAVSDAAVIVTEDQRLVAYVVGEMDGLREALAGVLPEYMVPSLFVELEKIPLTANGKLDRRALPDPETGAATDAYIAPRSETEETIAEVWGQVLGLDKVGVEDNFFDLGGHSILAVRLISRLQAEYDLDLPVRVAFERPTVAQLAVEIEDRVRAEIDALLTEAP
ncbi:MULTISPECIES: non-ribosomal peptide synthetase [unclassified Streptomyces]|uniref:non-ribosomal peptide synthetase n=1 Tax=unclassified Streptomyces TaxID=2593676 RepID=UPI00224EA19B|nr:MULTISPECIES: non-ribosomal peptide synthetase [unclassified Streptomyces]MCX4992713.1 amino acid adenylation domain-containing protein [Streptomyces sp. NBC_00568]MCX5002050.1 amino acid adenylation domain-containing protein [Streptomyces sp. NBC_00638]